MNLLLNAAEEVGGKLGFVFSRRQDDFEMKSSLSPELYGGAQETGESDSVRFSKPECTLEATHRSCFATIHVVVLERTENNRELIRCEQMGDGDCFVGVPRVQAVKFCPGVSKRLIKSPLQIDPRCDGKGTVCRYE